MSNGHTYKRLALWATRLGRELRRKVHGGGYLLVHRLGEDDPTEHVNLLEVDKRLRRLQKRLRGVPPTEGHPQ